ncbi:hypothetical protein [Pseudalkalibacillus salsuginis]|uniref:hypothetical protein n=1 Tax=Pseudalkalibacillus salsuginis TaxID=2910972 RepID=UPI001F44F115|nr:hypothetical protein [Pseudalkalibacillus salsuginis]MCF6410201.1 hypothetical protein [Pseudalkalibacillus salsuginis]
MPDPFLQLQWHSTKLSHWLHLHDLPHIPIDHIVVISRPSTIIETTEYTPVKITHSANLPFEIEALNRTFPEATYNKKQLRKLSKLLLKKHTPHDPNVMKQFKIQPEELLPGVYCMECKTLTMERHYGRWICSECSFISGDAHFEALKDYRMLVNTSISNRELRKFLSISSSYVAKTLLRSMNIPSEGTKKGRRYKLTL